MEWFRVGKLQGTSESGQATNSHGKPELGDIATDLLMHAKAGVEGHAWLG